MKHARLFLIPLTLVIVLISTVGPVPAQEPTPLTLAEYGPYSVGRTTMTFVDENREDRKLLVEIWYPAIIPEGEEAPETGLRDAAPDVGDAPYPLILYSHGYGGASTHMTDYGNFAGLVTSRGFVLVALNHRDGSAMWPGFARRPLDVSFVLDQLTELAEGDLVGIIDTERTGVMGYSFGGYTALAMAGAEVDPPYLTEWCTIRAATPRSHDPCDVVEHWDEFEESIAPVNLGTDARWPSFGDERIRAAVVMAPWGGPLFGEGGLATVTVPTLVMGASRDRVAPYERDAAFMYTHLGSGNRFLLTFVGDGHMFIGVAKNIPPAFHFLMAFFGVYLQGNEDYAAYLTEDFVEQFDNLAWGPVETE